MILFSLLIFLFYSLFIIGSLLTDPPKTIRTLRQLTNSPFKLGVDEVPYIPDAFKRATDPDVVTIYDKVMKSTENALVSIYTGVDSMKRGGFALATDSSSANNFIRNTLTDSEKCQLQTIDLIQEFRTGLIVPNESPLRELIRIGLQKMAETGILSYHNKTWSGIKPKCEMLGPATFSAVDIVHLSSAIFVVALGIVISLTLLIFEMVLHHFSRHKTF